MTHREALDCPCRPEERRQLGGGMVMVHRREIIEGRPTGTTRSPDRICRACKGWHLTGHPHLEMVALLDALEEDVEALPGEGRRHVGEFIERAAVLNLLDPKRIAA